MAHGITPPWPAGDAQLSFLWGEGMSASLIGKEIGVTKNAVIGRVRRLGLQARPSPLGPGNTSRKGIKRSPPPKPVIYEPWAFENTRKCRFPLWPDGPVPRPAPFCGDPVRMKKGMDGLVPCVYCPSHALRCFQPLER